MLFFNNKKLCHKIFSNLLESLLSLCVLSLLLDRLQVALWGAPFSLQGDVITQLVLTHIKTRLNEAPLGCFKKSRQDDPSMARRLSHQMPCSLSLGLAGQWTGVDIIKSETKLLCPDSSSTNSIGIQTLISISFSKPRNDPPPSSLIHIWRPPTLINKMWIICRFFLTLP